MKLYNNKRYNEFNDASASCSKKQKIFKDCCSTAHKVFAFKYNINLCPHNEKNKEYNNDLEESKILTKDLIIFPSYMSTTREGWRSYVRNEVCYPIATFNFNKESVSLFMFPKTNIKQKCDLITLIADICYLTGKKIPSTIKMASTLYQYAEDDNVESYRHGNNSSYMNKSLFNLKQNWSKWIVNNYNYSTEGRCGCGTCHFQMNIIKTLQDFYPMIVENHSHRLSNHTKFSVRKGTKVTTISPYEAYRYDFIHGGVVEKFFSPLIGMQLKMVHTIFGTDIYHHKKTILQTKQQLVRDSLSDVIELLDVYTPLSNGVCNIIAEYSFGVVNDEYFKDNKNIIIIHHNNRSVRLIKAIIQLYNRYDTYRYSSNFSKNTFNKKQFQRIFEEALKYRSNKIKKHKENMDIYCNCRGNILGLIPTSKLRHLVKCEGKLDNNYIMHWAFLSEVLVDYSKPKCYLPYSKSDQKKEIVNSFVFKVLCK